MPARYEFLPEMLPLVVMVTHDSLKVEDIAPVFGHYRELARRRQPYVSVSDSRVSGAMPDAATRKEFAKASRDLEPLTRGLCHGIGIVLGGSAMLRGVLTAIEWVAQREQPSTYFGTMPEAIDWAIAIFEKQRLPVTDAIRAYRASLDRAPTRAPRANA
jgi:hypothetical protein